VRYDPVTQLVLAFLEWNASPKQAAQAYGKLMTVMVDINDLRVSHPNEVVAIIGERYPKAVERAHRLRDTLQDIFIREHAVSLEGLVKRPKREVANYLNTLRNIVPYAASQVFLLCFEGHAIPVDENLLRLLQQEGAADPEATLEQIQSSIERGVKAVDALAVHAIFRAWIDSVPLQRVPTPARDGNGRANRSGKAIKPTTSAPKAAAKPKKMSSKTKRSKPVKKTSGGTVARR
jgi:endonuclease III